MLIAAIGVLLIAAICTALVHYNKLIDINDNSAVLAVVQERMVISADSTFFEIRTDKDYAAVFYKENAANCILILKRDCVFPQRYKYFSFSTESGNCCTYKYSEVKNKNVAFISAVSITESENKELKYQITRTDNDSGYIETIVNEAVTYTPYYSLNVFETKNNNYCFDCGIY